MANEEKQYISSKAKEYAQTNNLSQAQAQRLLMVAASYYNDKTILENYQSQNQITLFSEKIKNEFKEKYPNAGVRSDRSNFLSKK